MSNDAMVPVDLRHVATFDDRRSFIRERAGAELRDGAEQLCNVLADTNEGILEKKVGFPWVSPVIGSGATGDLDEAIDVEASARSAVASLRDPADRIDAAALAAVLLAQRLPGREVSVDPLQGDLDHEVELTGLLLLTVARLTRTYHRFRSLEASVLGRSGDGTARLPNTAPSLEVIGEYVRPTVAAMAALRAACSEADDPSTLLGGIRSKSRSVLDGAVRRLDPPEGGVFEVHLADVTALTELCWFSLSEPLYPEWSDLLWGLFLVGPNWPPSPNHGPRPLLFGHDNAVIEISRKYRDRTTRSWKELQAAGPGRDRVHDVAAELLIAQARYRLRWFLDHGPAKLPPVASAYVTTFDLELEMALLARGQDFVTAMPVNASWVDSKRGSLQGIVWIGRVVRAGGAQESDLLAMMEPTSSSWFLLSNVTDYEQVKDADGEPISFLPTVVRLAGSPLVTCPEVVEADRLGAGLKELLGVGPSPTTLSHAVLLDEYVGLDHVAAMLRGIAPTPAGGGKDYELPRDISGANLDHGYSRFWTMLGVQFSDAAVRSTIGVQLAIPRTKSGRSSLRPKRNGVAVQGDQPMTGEAEDLIRRIGLDIVRSPLAPFLNDLRHCAHHVDVATSRLPLESEFLEDPDNDREHLTGPNLADLPSSPVTTCHLPVGGAG